MTVDPALVTRKLLLVAADIEALRPVAARGRDAYLGSQVDQAFVERYLERLIGRMITGMGHPPPSDYYASFVRLGDLGVLESPFARNIARAAGLRNRIVHEYDGLDPAKVFDALIDALRDVPHYLAQVNEYLARSSRE